MKDYDAQRVTIHGYLVRELQKRYGVVKVWPLVLEAVVTKLLKEESQPPAPTLVAPDPRHQEECLTGTKHDTGGIKEGDDRPRITQDNTFPLRRQPWNRDSRNWSIPVTELDSLMRKPYVALMEQNGLFRRLAMTKDLKVSAPRVGYDGRVWCLLTPPSEVSLWEVPVYGRV